MDNYLYINIAIQTIANTFWLFAIVWEVNQRAKEAKEKYDETVQRNDDQRQGHH